MTETNNNTYEEIQKLTKKQTRPIIFIIISIILISFLTTNIPRVINTNFYDIDSNDLNSISISYSYYSNELNQYSHENVTISRDSEVFNDVISLISRYDYKVSLKTFMGLQQSFSSSGNIMTIFLNYGNDYKYISLYNNRVVINGVSYKMDFEQVDELINNGIYLTNKFIQE